MRRASMVVAAVLLVLAGCTGPSTGEPALPTPSVTGTPVDTDTRGVVEFDGLSIAYHCAGEGGPTVILEAGSDSQGTTSFTPALFDPIAEVTTVCTYDRLGTGMSSDPPNEPRTFADLVSVLDGVIDAWKLPPPYVMVGQSAGAGIAIAYAKTHPDRVAALVPIEGYHDDPDVIAGLVADAGLTWEDSRENVDPLPATLEINSIAMPIGNFPVLVISASRADEGGPENQAYWLGLSPNSRQIVVEGPHDLQETAPEELATAILDVLGDLQTS
jgi:pimeloyl-ACP methyl ester carboxylesterase